MSDKQSIEFLQERIKAARRQIPCDLVLKKGRVVNVFSGEILENFSVEMVYKDGRLVVRNGKIVHLPQKKDEDLPSWPIKIPSLTPESFRIRKLGARARVIEVIPGQILTKARVEEVLSDREWVLSHNIIAVGVEDLDLFTVVEEIRRMGGMTLSFLALPVIPELKLTDRGLVDIRMFAEVPLFV
jgi:adenine deaminase